MNTVRLGFTALGALTALLSGCGRDPEVTTTPTVSKDVLTREITERLTTTGEVPQSVTCREDLLGEVGRTARCEVVLSPTNSFEPVISVTGVDGSSIDYVVRPAVSKEQLEQAVSRLAAVPGVTIGPVVCDSGLDGTVGAVTQCDVDSGGVKVRRTVAVNNVEGLMMNFDLVPS
ncbi:DUF4333 domain-containing protein [Mycobacterium sp. B14F4]|uniref:DUF4333 domain-containing protein n=1 Tax=Mycobacterium sp. B14F4 TaxID=3153565 RepID=UPI00325CF456